MNSDERSLRLDNRNLSNLETRVTELQKVLDEQLDALSDTVLCHSAEIDRLIGRMPESDVHYRGANVPLTPFYGNRDEDFTQYLKQFEIICDANNYKADKKAQILASQLRDKAFFVYDSLTDDQKANYAILKEELCGKFQTTDHQRYAHQKFQARKQGTAESVADYGCNVHKLEMAALTAVEADQRDALIREKFISGLLPHLQELIVYSNPKNFHEAMTFAERLEGVQANKPDRSARHVMLLESIHDRLSKLEVHGPVYASTNLRPDEALAIERAKPQPNASNYAPAMNFGDNRQATRQGGIVCYKCNRTGHLARNCFRNQNMNNVICRNCNAMGHFARNCQRRRVLMRGRGTVSRTGNWTRGRSSNMIGYNQAPARSMGISRPTDDARASGDEPQRWQQLIGALRIETGKPKVWKVLPNRELSEPPRKQLEHQVRRAVKYKAFLSIAMCLVIIATITGKSTGHEQKFKTSGPMLCQASVAKSLWKLPRSFNCPEGNHSANEDVQEQNFQLYKQNYIQYKSDAWKCVKITEVVETFTYFFGDENLKRQRKQSEPVSSEECIAMKRFKQCGNQEMIFQGGIYQTTNELNWYFPGGGVNCSHWKQFKATNCFMYQSHVYKRHGSTKMESAVGDVSKCSYERGQCVLKDFSFLIWDTNNNSFCNVLPWKVVPGKLYGTSWLSDDSNLALTFTRKKEIKDCQERPLLLSDQGIAVKPIPNSEEYRQKRQLSMKDIKAMRQFVTKGGIVSSAQLAASMQALEMKWRQNTNFAFSHALNSVCNFLRSVIELLRTQVLADPTNAVRSLTNQSNVFARSGGNVIEIYSCEELERNNYQCMPMNNSCTAQLPIKFQINNNTHLGYLDPITNIVHRYASPIDCNLVKDVPIQIKDKTFLYQSVSGDVVPATKIPTLKIMQWNIEPVVDMKATIFHEIVIYSWSELQTHISLNDIIGGLLKQQVILKRLGVLNDEEGSNKAADNAVSPIMNRGYFGFLRGLSLNFFQVWTFCVCLYVSVCVLLIHCCPLNGIPTALKAVWTLKEKLTQAQIKSAADTEPAEPSAPQLLRNLSRTSHEIRPLNLYNSGPPFQLSSPPQLKALPPPQLSSFSVSEDYLTFAPRPLHKAYPSLPVSDTTLETEPQPFRINCLSGLSQTIVNVWLDQLYLKALLDTGSDFSIINEVTYNRLKKPLEGPIRQAQTATDQIICTSGEVKATLRTATTDCHRLLACLSLCVSIQSSNIAMP